MLHRKLGEIAELKTGPFGTQLSASEYSATGIPIINVKNIGYGDVISSDLDHVPPSVAQRLSVHLLHTGDIVFGRKGSVDRHSYISEKEDGWMQGSDCIRVRCHSDVNSHYLSYYLRLDSVKKQVNNAAVGSTMASLNTEILKDIDVILSNRNQQDVIASALSKLDEKIYLNIQINDNLSESLAMVV